jgi:phage terminase large subunit-like protein
MPNNLNFFKKTNVSEKVKVGGPSPEDQILAMANNKYWIVLNSHLLAMCTKGSLLCDRANAFKHALQTYGSVSDKLPDKREGKGLAKGHIFHGHVNDNTGTTYVIEWSVIDKEKRMIALIGFDKHENYKFRSTPLNEDDCKKIVSALKNITTFNHAIKKIEEAKNKVHRTEQNYRNCA